MPAVFRIGDPFDCGDTQAQGSGNVFVNGMPVASLTHLTAGHCFGPVPIDTASATVFVNNLGIARAAGGNFPGDHHPVHFCGPAAHDGRALTGSPNVFSDDGSNAALFINTLSVGQLSSETVAADYVEFVPDVSETASYGLAALSMVDEEEVDDSQGLAVYPPPPRNQTPSDRFVIMSKSNGVDPATPPPDTIEVAPPPTSIPPGLFVPDCSDIINHVGEFSDNFQLSPNYKLKDLTTQTFVSKWRVREQGGLTEKQIVCNLRYVAYNVLERLRSLYPTRQWRVNSGLRKFAVSETGSVSQHSYGQAVDVEFLNMTKDEKFYFARDFLLNDITFDQFIFETRGGPSTWYHFSVKMADNRRKVTTTPRPGVWRSGLHRIA